MEADGPSFWKSSFSEVYSPLTVLKFSVRESADLRYPSMPDETEGMGVSRTSSYVGFDGESMNK